jgi:hypothetical protein
MSAAYDHLATHGYPQVTNDLRGLAQSDEWSPQKGGSLHEAFVTQRIE